MDNTSDLSKQPALRNWQSKVYDKGPYQIPDYENFAAIVQEHERMAAHIEELSAELERTNEQVDQLEYNLERTNKQLFELTESHEAMAETVKRNADLVAKHVRWM
jgi:peptidoglycan hydrolase CwlO-like protein